MSGRLKHRPMSSSRSERSRPSTEKGINGFPSENQQQPCGKKRTRSRTDSGERLKEEDRPTIKAVGEHWEVHPYQGSRKPPIVIGALVREMYPDVVDTVNGPKPVLTWEDFKQTSTHGESNDKRVVNEFWWRFKCHPEDRAEADVLLEKKFKKMVTSMLSEEKQAVIQKLYKDDNVPQEDVDEDGNRWPTKEALINAKPIDFTTSEGWALLCEHWSTPTFRKASLRAKRSRGNELYHHSGARSLTATRQYLELKTGVDPGLAGAWLHNHELHPGTNDGRLCSQSATDKWAQYEEAMANKYGPNWKAEHPNFDASVIYEYVGRMSHGKLGIADEAISIAEKESIKTRKRSAAPHASAREKRLERENEKLRKDNSVLSEIKRVVRAMAAKGGLDYDALAQETTTNLATSESEGGLSKENEKIVADGGDEDNIGGTDYVDEDDVDYNYDNIGYDGHELDENSDYDGEDYGLGGDVDYDLL